MPPLRRQFLRSAGSSLSLLLFAHLVSGQTPRPLPSPNAPNPNAPGGLEGIPATKDGNSRRANPQLAMQMRSDVQKLYDMVVDLKKQVDSTDLNSVLPMGIVKEAQQIEKLAKHIKDEAKG